MFLWLAFKLMEVAEKSWRKIRGIDRIKPLLDGVPFKDDLLAPSKIAVKTRLNFFSTVSQRNNFFG